MKQAYFDLVFGFIMTLSFLAIFAIGLIGVSGSTLIALGFINAACIARTGFNRLDNFTRVLILFGAVLGILFGILRLIWCFRFPQLAL